MMTASGTLEATARWIAAVRASESLRPDALFRDPWAAELAGADGRAWRDSRSDESVLPIVVRVRYFDDWLISAVADADLRQVVLLGAGLDTRAFRLPWPAGVRLFELDQAALLEEKSDLLARASASAACSRHTVGVDLATDWPAALLAAGLDRDRPVVWLAEGFLYYLADEQLLTILDDVTALSVPGSRLGFDTMNRAVLTSPYTRPWVEMQAAAGAPWLGTLDDPVAILAERGWSARLDQAGQPDAQYGRWTLPVVPVEAPGFPHLWLVSATRNP